MLTLKESAKAVGKSKQTIYRAVKSGKVSATKDINNNYLIEPSELFRVFEPVAHHDIVKSNEPMQSDDTAKDELIKQLKEQLEKTEQRLSESEKERREVTEKLTLLLTDQSEKKEKKRVGIIGRIGRIFE